MNKNMMLQKQNIGIDVMEFSTSKYYIHLETLAKHRNVDFNKYYTGIGQEKMAVFPFCEDIVSMGFEAARKAIQKIDNPDDIDLLIFATESSFDLSKCAGIYIHHFLNLKKMCRVFEIKQACYSGTAALQLAKSYINEHVGSKVLIIASDIVKYSSNSSGEPTQGGAAVAMIISEDPRILVIENSDAVYTNNIMDFWRPIETQEALFDGKLSAASYLKSLSITFKLFLEQTNLSEQEIDLACFHAPFGKIVNKAHTKIFNCDCAKSIKRTDDSLIYNTIIGNSCSASLYLCLISLLDNVTVDIQGLRVGLFSYGSGCVSEYFSGIVVANYKSVSSKKSNQEMLCSRIELSFDEYENISSNCGYCSNYYANSNIYLSGIENYQRIYKYYR